MKATDRRAQILEVAAQEFADGGLRGASIDAIARAAGITQPYVFRIFGSKKALFLEVVAGSFTQLTDSMRAAADGETGLEALAAMGARYNALLADRTALQLQLQAYAACGDPEVREAVRGHLAELWDTVAATTGLDAVTIKTFLAFGMLLNTNAALDLAEVDAGWARGIGPGSGRAWSVPSPAAPTDEPPGRHASHRPGSVGTPVAAHRAGADRAARGRGGQPRCAPDHQRGRRLRRLAGCGPVDADRHPALGRGGHPAPRPARRRASSPYGDARHAGRGHRGQRVHGAAGLVRAAGRRPCRPGRRPRSGPAAHGHRPRHLRPAPRSERDRHGLGGDDGRDRGRLPA